MGDIAESLEQATAENVEKERIAGEWAVASRYRRARFLSGGEWFISAARHKSPLEAVPAGETARKELWPYAPLVKYPHLFLAFARLAADGGLDRPPELETDKNAAVALEWAEDYGVLGFTEVWRDGIWRGYNLWGGSGDTVAEFAKEAWVANEVLTLYEAATDPAGVGVGTIASYMPPRFQRIFASTPAAAREGALRSVVNLVQERVKKCCFPALYPRKQSGYESGYDFHNLLGAMYLQMHWLLCSGDAKRCKSPECNQVITFEQPARPEQGLTRNDRSGGYRTRADKTYCSDRCRQRAAYLRRKSS